MFTIIDVDMVVCMYACSCNLKALVFFAEVYHYAQEVIFLFLIILSLCHNNNYSEGQVNTDALK